MIAPLPLLLGAASTALVLGYTDHKTGRMPNAITCGSLLLALVVQFVLNGKMGLLGAALGLTLTGLAPLALFAFTRGEGIGGGDVKALLALGAWLGADLGLESELTSLLILAAGALIHSFRLGRLGSLLGRAFAVTFPWTRSKAVLGSAASLPERTYLRFGPYLAAGVSLCCLNHYIITTNNPFANLL